MNRASRWLPAVAAGLALGPPAMAVAPFSFDGAPGRLPKDVVPVDYQVAIVPDIQALSLEGTEGVLLEFRAATATIQFNSLNETVRDVRFDGRAVENVVTDNEQQLTTVTLPAPAAAGRHTLRFAYRGKIEKAPMGLFAQDYLESQGQHEVLLSTLMEPTDARRLFPCWDEPAFRATFKLRATIPESWASVSNMPVERRIVHGGLATTTFQRSPKMPSYLVEYSAGHLRPLGAAVRGKRLGLWAVRGHEGGGKTALADARQILSDYNRYFDHVYPLPKLDAIALPGGFSGGMENWGAITYDERTVLLTSASTLADRQEVFSIQAHEIAHQWFGDLVTMGWWDDIWLNESFASWMGAKETARRHPDWHWWLGQDVSKESAMAADSRATSHAIQQHVTDEVQANNAFDSDITYRKGQAFLRMLEASLGEEVFRSAMRRYMRLHAYSNATTADLWNALSQASGRDVGALAAEWTEQPGFPLVSVQANCDASGARSLRLAQQRFMLGESTAQNRQWTVPLRVRSGTQGAAHSVFFDRDGQEIAAGRCSEPLSLNADAIGYYRVKYDPQTLAVNASLFAQLAGGDRIALLDDQWALVESGAAPLPSYLALVAAMGTDLVPRAWEQVSTALQTIEYAERGTEGHEAFKAYARSVLRPEFERLGWHSRAVEAADVQQLRRTLIGDLGNWGEQGVIDEARRRVTAFLTDHRAIAPDDQPVMLAVAARYADEAMFRQLRALARATADPSERARFYSALMQVGDPGLAVQAAQVALSTDIPPQFDSMRLRLVFQLAPEHQQLAWKTFTENAATLLQPEGLYGSLIAAQDMPKSFWSGVPLAELETWVRAHVPEEMSLDIERGLEAARFRLAEKSALVRQADAYLH
ncbi:MAG TPA: M1 family metallopeptidase [Steroidobacteraceae bacterium]|nr:M1 family metallopeptidase [Steroidobacteraceae bacterium]